jgi:serine/threonine protein kinase/DNA-binding beta-propeller fold protein YncE
VSEGSPVVPGGFAPGSRIAGYLLEEQIGQGGMAVVFRAHDERLDRTVALKILAPALASDEAFRQRFMRESRAAAAVDDPHIIPVFEAGEASGVLFIAMRWVRGGDVKSLVGQFGPMAPARVADILSQVASALDAAHTRGLVHRDVKPANMLLDASPGSGRPDHVYLSDFGLSKGSLQTSGLTGTGTFLGTLDYISPEQIEGKPVDGRADEYALACAAFELLTGAPPFQRDEAMATMYAQLSEPPPALSSRRRGLPETADEVFVKALAKAPADRYGSCREFAEALRVAFGLRPFDSGPGGVPSGGHPTTRIVRPSDPHAVGPIHAASGPAASGALGPSTGPAPATYPGPGYAGHSRYVSQGGHAGQGDAGAQGTSAAQGQVQVPAGAASGGGYNGVETQAAPRRQTAPDLTAPHLRQGDSGGYGQFGGPDVQASIVRPWWKSPLALIAAVVILIGGAAAAYALTKAGGGGGGGGGGSNGGPQPAAVLKPPTCEINAAHGMKLPVPARFADVPAANGDPFGIAVSGDGKAVFVTTDTALQVFTVGSDGSLSFARSYSLGSATSAGRVATTVILTRDNKYLLVAADDGIQVLDAAAAENGDSSVLVGTLQVPGIDRGGRAIDVAVTPDGHYAFVSLQFGDVVGVFNLHRAIHTDFRSAYVGPLNVGVQPVGLAVSPDGQTLYATNFVADAATPGTLTVISVVKATNERSIKSAVKTRVRTGCQPARVIVSSDSKTVWVTLRQSNYLLGYSAKLLRSDPAKALQAKVKVGQWPINLALVKDESRIVVSDNNGNDTSGKASSFTHNVAVVDPAAALKGEPALIGYIHGRLSPRDIAVSRDGFMYVINRDSDQIQIINLSKLP